jgi:hypothetical protein
MKVSGALMGRDARTEGSAAEGRDEDAHVIQTGPVDDVLDAPIAPVRVLTTDHRLVIPVVG